MCSEAHTTVSRRRDKREKLSFASTQSYIGSERLRGGLGSPKSIGEDDDFLRSRIVTSQQQDFDIVKVLPMIGVLLVAVCAGMAYFGFRGRTSVVGIDLGTTYSVVAVRATGGGIGEVEVVQDFDTFDGKPSRIVPSVVYYPPYPGARPIVGSKAKDIIQTDPSNVIYNAKRFIGRDFSHPAVKQQAAFQDFKVLGAGDSGESIGFKTTNGTVVTPEVVGSHVLGHLLSLARDHLGHNQVKSAIIAVPAKFDQKQREATAAAFKLSGLKVTRMLEEPTAAAIAYGLHRKDNVHHILVYDFGGGTLDVSVLHVSDGYVEVIGTHGDDRLGGADFDTAIAEFLMDKYKKYMHEEEGCEGGEVPRCTRSDLFPLSERIKISMSSADESSATCLSNECKPVTLTLSKDEYSSVIKPLLSRSSRPIHDVLEDLDMTVEDIDEVVMVGGTSRMPMVREVVKKELKKDELNVHIDPDITVAYGCASVID